MDADTEGEALFSVFKSRLVAVLKSPAWIKKRATAMYEAFDIATHKQAILIKALPSFEVAFALLDCMEAKNSPTLMDVFGGGVAVQGHGRIAKLAKVDMDDPPEAVHVARHLIAKAEYGIGLIMDIAHGGKYYTSSSVVRLVTTHQQMVARTGGQAVFTCDGCGMITDKLGDLQRCTKCRGAYYCDKACQKLHWSTHRLLCCHG